MIKMISFTKPAAGIREPLSLEIRDGRVVGFFSTRKTLRKAVLWSVLGLIAPDEGVVQVFYTDTRELTEDERQEMGAVFHGSGWPGGMRVRQIRRFLQKTYESFDEQIFDSLCEAADIGPESLAGKCTAFDRLWLQLAAALSHSPGLLVLDDVLRDLNQEERLRLLDAVREYHKKNRSCTVLIGSPYCAELAGYCDEMIVLHEGRVWMREPGDSFERMFRFFRVSADSFDGLEKTWILDTKKLDDGDILCVTSNYPWYEERYPDGVLRPAEAAQSGGPPDPAGRPQQIAEKDEPQ